MGQVSDIYSPDVDTKNLEYLNSQGVDTGLNVSPSGDVTTKITETVRFSPDVSHGIMIRIFGIDTRNSYTPTTGVAGKLTTGIEYMKNLSAATTEGVQGSMVSLLSPSGETQKNIGLVKTGFVTNITALGSLGQQVMNSSLIEKAYLYLPLPNDINFSYNASWGAENLTVTQYMMRNLFQNPTQNPFEVLGKGLAIEAAKGLLGRTTGLGVVRAGGVVFNPYKQLMYDSPDFRSFSFNWMLSPKNANESDNLNKIIWYLKKHMHPMTTGNNTQGGNNAQNPNDIQNNWLWLSPDFVDMKFVTSAGSPSKNPWIPLISDAVITGVGVQIDPKFHKGDNAPTAISLSINIMETKLYSQSDFGATYEEHQSNPYKQL